MSWATARRDGSFTLRRGYRPLVDSSGLLVMHRYTGARIHTSIDGGATWRQVDLQGDSWLTPADPSG